MKFKTTFDWKRGVLIAAALLMVTLGAMALWAAVVRHAMTDGPRLSPAAKSAVLAIASFPGQAKLALTQLAGTLAGAHAPLLIDRRNIPHPAQTQAFPHPDDPGYLLFSGLVPETRRQEIRLIRVADGATLATWVPPVNEIAGQLTAKKAMPLGDPNALRWVHPLLLEDGSVIFNVGSGAARLDRCGGPARWVLDQAAHHSIELGSEGQSFWTASRNEDYLRFNPKILEQVADDSLMEVSLDGRVLRNLSFTEILEKNQLGALVFGTAGSRAQPDPIHINQISVAPADGPHWKRGDLLISARHLSAVFLYRPSTGVIVWHRQGPWLNQHSARFVDDHRISVFDNHVYDLSAGQRIFLREGDVSRVFIYDFRDASLTQPWERLLQAAQVKTFTEGRAQVLPDGGLFVEETNHGRHLRFSKTGLMWERVNSFDEGHVGVVSWSRYLEAAQVLPVLGQMRARPCSGGRG